MRRNPIMTQIMIAKAYSKRKMRALQAVIAGGIDRVVGTEAPQCHNCGCDDINFLEIHHMNGGGNKEYIASGKPICDAILYNERGVSDLSILCKLCNGLDYLRKKYPAAVKYPAVMWS